MRRRKGAAPINHRLVALLAAVAAVGVAFAAGASALASPLQPFSLSARALLGPANTDLYLTVAQAGSTPLPAAIGDVRIRLLAPDGTRLRTYELQQLALADGKAVVPLAGPARGQVLEVKAEAPFVGQGDEAGQKDDQKLLATTTALLRPDLTVHATAPSRVVRTHPFTLVATVAETAGDTGAHATVSLYDGVTLLEQTPVAVEPGGSVPVSFALRYANVGSHSFAVSVTDADPAEVTTTNNDARTTVAVARYDVDGAVVSDEPNVTAIGARILADGGNAIDAAVAMQFALNVTQPQNVGIGGGATIVVHLTDGSDYAIDARETAPAATTSTMFVGKTNVNSSGIAVGVPGALRAAEVMLQRWGTKSLNDTLQPAIQLAENGFDVGEALAASTLPGLRCQNVGQPETKTVYCHDAGLVKGTQLRQPDLAKTLRLIAEQGTSVFYRGEIASAIVDASHRTRGVGGEGRLTLGDLAAYAVRVGEPIAVSYRGYDLLSAAGSSRGGIVVLQALKMLRRFPLGDAANGWGWLTTKSAHAMAEATRLALADSRFWMGDGPVPVDALLSDSYTDARSALIDPDHAFPSASVPVGKPIDPCTLTAAPAVEATAQLTPPGGDLTSHFSVLDKNGNAVSFTTTLTDAFGTGIMVPGYGFVLNDALSNFNQVPVASPATCNPGMNDPAPGERAMGATAPVIALKDGEPVLLTGSPGGSLIPAVVLNVVTNVIDHTMSLQAAVDAPRMWFDQFSVLWNPGVPDATVAGMAALGHSMVGPRPFPQVGGAESIGVDPATFALTAATDPRIPDATKSLLEPS